MILTLTLRGKTNTYEWHVSTADWYESHVFLFSCLDRLRQCTGKSRLASAGLHPAELRSSRALRNGAWSFRVRLERCWIRRAGVVPRRDPRHDLVGLYLHRSG